MAVKTGDLLRATLDAATLDSGSLGAVRGEGGVPGLTVLHHPDPRRVGDETRLPGLLAGGRAGLSRTEPMFAPPGVLTQAWPLGDPFLSRHPVAIEPAPGGGLVLRPGAARLVADGVPVETEHLVDETALTAGAVLELGKRVVLLLHRLPPAGPRPPDLGLVGEGAAMWALRQELLRVADTDVPVLLRGETGTGKELAARALHAAGPRASGPCVCVSMAAMPPATAASALFGHVRGAFTGAVSDHAGHFARADGGTLFLDEVGETPPDVQVMLLRALETGMVQPLGGRAERRVDVRLVAATDTPLEQAIAEGRFRAPLLHRLAGYPIYLPPLRARREDVGRLLIHFLREALESVGERARLDPPAPDGPSWLPAALVARLARHDWPGNVRQLRNVAHQIALSSRGLAEARPGEAVERLLAEPAATSTRAAAIWPGAASPGTVSLGAAPPSSASSGSAPLGMASPGPASPTATSPTGAPARRRPADISTEELVGALRVHGWRIDPAARALGLPRASLYMLIDRSDGVRKARDVPRDELIGAHEACGGDLAAMAARLEVSPRGLKLRLGELGLA